MTYEFEVRGNHTDPKGNPVPYFRMTQNTRWTQGARRYGGWKEYVVSEFLRQTGTAQPRVAKWKPIQMAGRTATMDIAIEWANRAHADCDNVFKGIADALFDNDKNLTDGSFTSRMSDDKVGKVLIKINIKDDKN